jgi:hypothetical protein
MLFSANNDGVPTNGDLGVDSLATIASMAIAESMARGRGRSAKVWVWIAAIVGPFYALGNLQPPLFDA